jgi:Tat protein translocase TatB subunit
MFDIGIQELIIIFLVALLVFGPEKLPQVGRTLGRWMIEIRKGIHNAKVQMDSEFDEAEKRTDEGPGSIQNAETGRAFDVSDVAEKDARKQEEEG